MIADRMDHFTLEFTEGDGAFFALADAQLKADALKQDVLPRLSKLLERALTAAHRVYGVAPVQYSTVTALPAFRPTRREAPVTHHYGTAEQGITATRSQVWRGIARPDGKQAKIASHRLAFVLDARGVRPGRFHWWQQYTPATNLKFIHFVQEHIDQIFQVMRIGELDMLPYHINITLRADDLSLIAADGGSPEFWGRLMLFPVHDRQLDVLVERFVMLFPIYDSYLRISLGQDHRFAELMTRSDTHLKEHADELVTLFRIGTDPRCRSKGSRAQSRTACFRPRWQALADL